MITRLLNFLNASPVNFLAVNNIVSELEAAGYRRIDPQMPIGKVEAGDKISQLVLIPFIGVTLQEVDDLGESDRGEKGFGSSGR